MDTKNKGLTINPKNTKNNNCFQYAITAALNYQNIDSHPERISKLKPFINNYNWKTQSIHHIPKTVENLNVIVRQLL